MAINLPLINGRKYSFASIESTIILPSGSAEIIIDISSIDYSDAIEISKVPGTSRMDVGWTVGQYNAEDTSIVMGKSSFQKLIDRIGPRYYGVNMVFNVKYADILEPLTVDRIECRLGGATDSHAAGPDNLNVTVTMPTFVITRNNLQPV